LLNQWISEIKRFLPDATIGTIQGQKIDTKGKDIVIGMLQSISMKDYEPELFREFGFTIIDECHHIAAEVFSRALPKINSYYMLGLSATPNRADGLSKVFHHYLGPFIYKIMTRNDEQKVRVHTIYYSDNHPDYSREELTAFNKVCVPKMVTNIVNCGNRNLLINCLIKRLVADGRKILVLSDRRDHLSCIYSMVYPYATVGYYMGGMKQKELDISAEKQVILGTYPMSSEGLNIPDLDTAIFTTSKSSIEQSIGRIVRKVHDKQPYAFDIVDDFSVFPRQYYKREKIYKKFKYELYETHIETNEKTNENSFEYQLDHGFKQKRYGKGAKEEDSESEPDEESDLEEGVQVKPKKKTSKTAAPVECCIEDD
jgi:superfamily II DNA or RNA helicase